MQPSPKVHADPLEPRPKAVPDCWYFSAAGGTSIWWKHAQLRLKGSRAATWRHVWEMARERALKYSIFRNFIAAWIIKSSWASFKESYKVPPWWDDWWTRSGPKIPAATIGRGDFLVWSLISRHDMMRWCHLIFCWLVVKRLRTRESSYLEDY